MIDSILAWDKCWPAGAPSSSLDIAERFGSLRLGNHQKLELAHIHGLSKTDNFHKP